MEISYKIVAYCLPLPPKKKQKEKKEKKKEKSYLGVEKAHLSINTVKTDVLFSGSWYWFVLWSWA